MRKVRSGSELTRHRRPRPEGSEGRSADHRQALLGGHSVECGMHACRHAVSGRWFVAGTYVKVSGSWPYVDRAVDENGQFIYVFVSKERDTKVAVKFFGSDIGVRGAPTEVTTDRSAALASATRACPATLSGRPPSCIPFRAQPAPWPR